MKKNKIILFIIVFIIIVFGGFILFKYLNRGEISFRDSEDSLLMTGDVLESKKPARIDRDGMGYPAIYLKIKDTKTFYKVTEEISKRNNNVIVIWYNFEKGKDSYKNEKETCGDLKKSRCISISTVTQGYDDNEILIMGSFEEEDAKTIAKMINKTKSIF